MVLAAAVVGTALDEVVLLVVEGITVDEAFAVEDAAVEEELLLIGCAPVPGAWYIFNLYDPPQNSDELPLQGILQPEKPSGAGAPPPVKELAQSLWSISVILGDWTASGYAQHSFAYSNPAYFWLFCPHTAVHRATVMAPAPPGTAYPVARVRVPWSLVQC